MSTILRSQKSLLCSSSRYIRQPIRSLHSSSNRVGSRGRFSRRARLLFTPPSAFTASTTIVNSHNLSSSLQRKSFSSTSAAMTATKIDGTATAKQIRESIRAQIEETQKSNPRYKPSLKIIQVGERSDSSKYISFQNLRHVLECSRGLCTLVATILTLSEVH